MKIEAPPQIENKDLQDWLYNLWLKIQDDHLYASGTWNPAEIADGDSTSNSVTVPGAVIGDHVIATHNWYDQFLTMNAHVSAANTVLCILTNNTGAPVNLSEGTVYVRVLRKVT